MEENIYRPISNEPVEEQKFQLQSNLLATKKSLAKAKRMLTTAKTEYRYVDIIKLQIRIEQLKTKVTRLESLKNEFGW